MMPNMAGKHPHWTRAELLLAFRLYCRTPFGKLHRLNPEIIDLGKRLNRTPSAVGMKACNFASMDPAQQARNIAGLGNAGRADREMWEEFQNNPEAIAAEAEAAYVELTNAEAPPLPDEFIMPEGPTETLRYMRTRRVQRFFAAAVMASYEHRCALSDIAVPELLNAGHIIPWSVSVPHRADPRNGIALNILYDRAFDRGLITLDESLRVVVSPRLKIADPPIFHRQALIDLEGRELRRPARFAPDPAALAYHRDNVFHG